MDDVIVSSGPYSFRIRDNTLWSSDKKTIYSRNFKIGGNTVTDCVSVSIIYKNGSIDYAYIPTLLYDPDCSLTQPLDKGGGTATMIKTLLSYVSSQIPALTHISFDDMSNIECATEEEIQKGSRFRKKGTNVKPMPLYYFSIAFNGQTWYERHFNAHQMDEIKHQAYRKTVDEFLYSPEFKELYGFDRFVSLFGKSEEEMTELSGYYNKHTTFSEFFKSIPKEHRCGLVGPWIEQFMRVILNNTFSNNHWAIPLHHCTFKTTTYGGILNDNGNSYHALEKCEGVKIDCENNIEMIEYYCPNGIIRNNYRTQNICISPDDI